MFSGIHFLENKFYILKKFKMTEFINYKPYFEMSNLTSK